jgi:hypothetical protein
VHLVNPKTGKVLGADEKNKAAMKLGQSEIPQAEGEWR